ncbi:MAG TPA: tRNA (adenosine(37)-N6)-dimethylallyltransferase MiaA [Victivallales bacterium]|nr:tRNA (adenosine(37)-N6)-dimethylallyltransferase MiaA [Victivallales bacterium]HRR07015.1 tRNA (adenosine(37)-N6)-dimethylallyltransferase MiaA [Victivallales bacterium]
MGNDRPLIFLMGPTAVGKSQLALEIALQFDGEIINADSMQLYRGLDIGTAKASPEEQKKIKHHLIDILDISEKINVFKYKKLAEEAACEIRKRGKNIIFVGGSGLYLKTLIEDINEPPASTELMAKLQKIFSEDDIGKKKLAEFLETKSFTDFQRTYPNYRRMLRAAELIILKEKIQTERKKTSGIFTFSEKIAFFITMEREELKKRIMSRTEEMLKKGWIEEARKMILKGLLNSPTAKQAIGYNIIGKFLSNQISYNEMKEEIIRQTCQLAKKQNTWFKNQHKDAIKILLPHEKERIFQIIKSKLS